MKKVSNILILLLLASCTRHKLYDLEPAPMQVEFVPLIEGVATRMTGASWEHGDAVGMFMLSTGQSLPLGIVDEVENHKYVTLVDDKNVTFLPLQREHTIYYPKDDAAVDFVAYYPFKETGTNAGQLNNHTYPIRVDDQSAPGKIDLLYTIVKNRNSGSNPVHLYLTHQLTKFRVQINHRPGADVSILKDMKVILNNMPLAAGFSLVDTSITHANETGEREAGAILLHTTDAGAEYEAIIIPHPAHLYPSRSILFSIPGAGGGAPYDYSWDIADESIFQSGKEYTFIFMLEATGLKFAGITIADWDHVSVTPTAIEMISIRGGTFLMGSSDGSSVEPNDDQPEAGRKTDEVLHSVTVSDFRISRYPITNAQYLAFLNVRQVPETGMLEGKKLFAVPHPVLSCTVTQGANSTNTYLWNIAEGKENHPVTHVSWEGATAFTRWQGAKLPTEAQWEYACRAGKTTPYHFDMAETSLDKYAWYEANNNTNPNNGVGTKSVGLKYYNPFGLYDMYGNVWEWCADWYGNYSIPAPTDPVNNDNSTGKRVLRGGAFNSPAVDCRSATRFQRTPESLNADQGFRIVL